LVQRPTGSPVCAAFYGFARPIEFKHTRADPYVQMTRWVEGHARRSRHLEPRATSCPEDPFRLEVEQAADLIGGHLSSA
jgi:hypothetical protein